MMKTKLLLPSVLLGAMLIAMPAIAQQPAGGWKIEPTSDLDFDATTKIAIVIDGTNNLAQWYDGDASGWVNVADGKTIGLSDTFNISTFAITGVNGDDAPYLAFVADVAAGKYNFGNVTVTGEIDRGSTEEEGLLAGLVFDFDSAFTGLVKTGTITVENEGNGHTSALTFVGNFAGSLTTGDITVIASTGDAASAFTLWGTFTDATNFNIGNIDVYAESAGNAYGIVNFITQEDQGTSAFAVKNAVLVVNYGAGAATGVQINNAEGTDEDGGFVTISGLVAAANVDSGAASGVSLVGDGNAVWVTAVGTATVPKVIADELKELGLNANSGVVMAFADSGLATGIQVTGPADVPSATGDDAFVIVDGLVLAMSGGNDGDASAQGVAITGDRAYVALSGAIMAATESSHEDAVAIGIDVVGDDAEVHLTSSAVIGIAGGGDGSASVAIDGDNGWLVIGDAAGTFTNDELAFVSHVENVAFDGNAQLAEGVFRAVESFEVGTNQVNLGNGFGIVAGGDLTIDVEAGGIFQTVGQVRLEDGGVHSLTVSGGGRANLLGELLTGTSNTINVQDGSTLAVDATKIGATTGLTFDLAGEDGKEKTNRLEVYGETQIGGEFEPPVSLILNDVRQVVNKSIFGDWYAFYDEDEEAYRLEKRVAKYVNMEQGFLTAGAIRQRNTGYNAVSRYLISAQPNRNGYRGQALCDPCEPVAASPCDPCGTFGSRNRSRSSGSRTAWVNYVGRSESFGNWDLGSDGVQVGSDLFRSNRSQLGVFFGYEGGWAKGATPYAINRTDKIDSDDIYFGVYGARVLRNGADVRVVYNHGRQDFNMVRNHNANIYGSEFKGRTNEVNLELGKRVYDGAWSIRPLVGLDILNTRLNAAQEKWLNENDGFGNPPPVAMSYNKAKYTQVFLRSGVDVNFKRNRLGFNSGLSYAYDLNGSDFTTRVGSTINDVDYVGTLRSTRYGRQLLTLNVGGDYLLGRNLTVFGGYTGLATLDRSGGFQSIGHVGGAVKW